MLVVNNIAYSYTEGLPIIKGVSFSVEKGANIALIGESGCGKSTLLKLIYGLYDLDQGEIHCGDKRVLGPAYNLVPGMDNMRYLAQDYDLMPHISVYENIGKFLSNFDLVGKKKRIEELLEVVGLVEYADTLVKYLSGGQQQRVAIARVLASEPELLLLDEPFSHIDYSRRSVLRRDLFAYLKEKGIACIVATHDSLDTLGFADETIVLKEGQIIDMGDTREVYEHPINKYVASLFGEVNELMISDFTGLKLNDEALYVYPHQLMRSSQRGQLDVIVTDCYFKGDGYLVKCLFQGNRVIYFNHPLFIEKNTEIKLALKKYE
ncbi:ABC transporter ATP-binding protein [Myroides pelagicus]|uniref:ATP-binding cassette domain-containing protein n=1 Tax=Myroides pelagicus TaxID=270914 RepID=A0A7K1GQS2_9FLAO|nr:ABC transporter ATP-binding protein [Myroides pelagicus]MEC4114992.1 ABC transporter ATP-binding protein [Myroides pelagicus]MTH30683.1 ATP-binding cassette domain-containing protein [Myroides pelagicus]